MSTNENQNWDGPESSKKSSNLQKTIIAVLAGIILILIVVIFFVMVKKSVTDNQTNTNENGSATITPILTPKPTLIITPTPMLTPTPTPTSTPSPTPKATPSPSPSPTPQAKKPDLYVEKYEFSDDPELGKEVTVEIKISNKGKDDADSFYWEWYSKSNTKVCSEKVDGLKEGKSTNVECKYTYTDDGDMTTKVVVDSKSKIDESDEGNNTVTKKITLTEEEKADLYVSEYKFDHDPKQGEEFTVSITVYNKGDKAAGSFYWEWWPTASGKECRVKIDSLAAHGGQVVTCKYTYAGWSTYATKAVVDADNTVSESNESNNTYTKSVVPIH